MSIPKEPRQLMINVMYIVLTALLALNVSAAVFNAFEMVEKGLKKSNASLEDANASLPDAIAERAKKKNEYQKYADRAKVARAYSKEFTEYVENIIDTLIDQSGNMNGKLDRGDSIELNGAMVLKGKRDYSATTRVLSDGPKGEELKSKIASYKQKFLELIDTVDRATYASKIPLEVDDEAWKHDLMHRKNWSDFTFSHMPLTATLPIFRKFQNDAKAAESTVLNYLMGKVGGDDVVLDKYTIVSAPKKTYIIKGDKFESDLFLSAAASSKVNTKIEIFVGGRKLAMKDGVAKLIMPGNTTGRKTYNATVRVTNPVTNEVKEYKKSFEYEVGERSVAISAMKMNVFYIGVDNPVEVSASGISSNKMNVNITGGGGTINRNADGTYNVRVTQPTKKGEFAHINVTAPGIEGSKKAFRVKRIPTPVVKLGRKLGGGISQGEFKLNRGLIPTLEGFDFDAKCNVVGYRLVRAPRRDDPKVSENRGGKYNAKTQALVNKAKAGDRYFYENVKCKCPGDKYAREVNSLTFMIK